VVQPQQLTATNRIIADMETDMGHGAAYYAQHVRLEN
jgi:hypothetical protein